MLTITSDIYAWEGMAMPRLRVDGRNLKDENGNIVKLHGYAQTFSPWFNERGTRWNNYDVEGCLKYNQQIIDRIMAAGWKMNFVRMHMDPYWSNTPGRRVKGENDISAFDFGRFEKYLDEVFVPMAEYAIAKGMYVVMRPPGVCPEKIAVGDEYQKYLLKVWRHVARHTTLKNHPNIMFELANEPINIKGPDGTFASSGDGHFKNAQLYFQTIIDKIRGNQAQNVIWVPGLGYQSQYAGYATYRFTGENVGFAVHVYPGWYNSDAEEDPKENIVGSIKGGGYEGFQRGWDAQVGPVADYAPVMVTEMDWAPAKYDSSWGKSITGIAGGEGFGANFKYIADKEGNVSWMIFTSQELLAQFKDVPGTPGNYTFLNDPEACPWPVYHWFKEYAGETVSKGELTKIEISGIGESIEISVGSGRNIAVKAIYADGTVEAATEGCEMIVEDTEIASITRNGLTARLDAHKVGTTRLMVSYTSSDGSASSLEVPVTVSELDPFPLVNGKFNPSIWEKGSFDEDTRTLITGKYGFGGWEYRDGLNLSSFSRITVELGNDNDSAVSFRLFDKNDYWSKPAMYDFGNSRKVVVDLHDMKDENGNRIDPSHLYIIGFWSYGNKPIIIHKITLE